MAEHITIEALQAQVQTLKEKNLKLVATLRLLAKSHHEERGHFGNDFRHCASPSCVVARKEIEANHGL